MPNLVGIGNSQVPTNAMLGGLAYQDSVGEINIEKIRARTSDTAVDIFVYDTRKDSDGGAWRHRTQNTSWYNEGASATRGARKEFPAVAVIVAESTTITIYDGDDPNLSLWMKFVSGSGQDNIFNRPQYWTNSGVFALNGIICASNSTAAAESLLVINYVSDSVRLYPISGYTSYGGEYNLGIGGRSDSSGHYYLHLDQVTVGDVATDVAMAVLPNAPIDENTGLSIPVIVVATDHGLSYISEHGEIIDLAVSQEIHYATPSIAITKDQKLIVNTSQRTALAYSIVHVIPLSVFSSDQTKGYEYQFPNEGFYSYSSPGGTTLDLFDSNGMGYYDAIETELGYFALAAEKGLKNIQHIPQDLQDGGRNATDYGQGMQCEITTNHNTGWMQGDIRFASLSSIDDTDHVSSDLAPNNCATAGPGRTEANSTTGWTNGGMATFESSSTRASSGSYSLHLTANSNGDNCYFSFATVVGKTYVISCKLWVTHDSFTIKLGTTAQDGNQYFESPPIGTNASWQVFVQQFTATATTAYFNVTESSTSQDTDGYIDEVVVREGASTFTAGDSQILARSEGDTGVQAFGTITKTPVATGAELVAYSGFSGSNYLFKPYTSDLDFTDTMSIVLWVKGWVGSDSLLHRGPGTDRNQKTSFHLYCSYDHNYRLTLCSTTLSGSGNTVEQTFEIAQTESLVGWYQLCFTLSNGNVRGFLNGEEKTLSSNSFTGTNIFSQATERNGLWIGTGPVGGAADTASIALLRLSATTPTADQVKKMYEDEKHMFSENAKCTLHGTSDDVKAIAYDDTKNILHVGTSSGRSDFSGLVRINNTTTAVTTAISASNGFVAEQ